MEPRGVVLCPACRRLTSTTASCEHCGSALPARSEPPAQSGPLEELRHWTLELRTGDIGQEEFVRRLDAREARLQGVLQGLDELDIPEDMQLELAQELQAGRQGIHGFLQALQALREWAATGQPEALDTGIALATQATSRMNEAVRLNWRTFRTYQEAAEEFLGQVGYDGPA